jgi:short subunit dehydrogenase-like uncharacterized protein
MADFILYGAYGYTGELITRLAKDFQLRPLLAGRSAEKLAELSQRTGYDYEAVTLDDEAGLQRVLRKAKVVLHAAGPFVHTAEPMQRACLATGTHYLDITGEIPVFERTQRMGKAARSKEILLMSGTGFDVVPTDCLAAYLKDQLPDANQLRLAFAGLGGGMSQGTAKTMVENLGKPGAIRRDGKIVTVPIGYQTMTIPFREDKKRFAMTIPWGDVSTAYYTTGIPNIEVYTSIDPATYKWVKLQRFAAPLLRTALVRNLAKRRIEAGPAGPTDEQRRNGRSLIWGQVINPAGKIRAARLDTLDGYTLTAKMSLMILQRVLAGDWDAGAHTPAGLYGPDLIMEVESTTREDI